MNCDCWPCSLTHTFWNSVGINFDLQPVATSPTISLLKHFSAFAKVDPDMGCQLAITRISHSLNVGARLHSAPCIAPSHEKKNRTATNGRLEQVYGLTNIFRVRRLPREGSSRTPGAIYLLADIPGSLFQLGFWQLCL